MNKPVNSSITRRNFLASGSALLALPWLESMVPLAAAPALPKPPTPEHPQTEENEPDLY